MGSLSYGAESLRIEFEDHLLAHLQALMTAKLRRHEPFTISWNVTREQGSGRVTLWIGPAIPLAFHFTHTERLKLDPRLLERLSVEAASANGLDISQLVHQTASGRVISRGTY